VKASFLVDVIVSSRICYITIVLNLRFLEPSIGHELRRYGSNIETMRFTSLKILDGVVIQITSQKHERVVG
jgi:hypothetical protein